MSVEEGTVRSVGHGPMGREGGRPAVSLGRAIGLFARVPRGPVIAILMYVLMLVVPSFTSGSVTTQNYSDIFQNLADVLPLALAIGLTMILAEFDISVVSTFALGGVVAVQIGDSGGIVLGVVVAALVGVAAGLIQGGIVAKLNISSVPVTLAGFLALWGVSDIISHNEPVSSTSFGPGETLLSPVLQIFTVGSLIVIGCAVVLHLLLAFTRLGRDLRAVGGDRRASAISGIRVPWVIVGTFAAAGLIAGLGGALEGISFSAAQPAVSFSPLESAVIAAIVGGVGISGATGSPLGIMCGVLALGILQELLVIVQVNPNLSSVITGSFLLVIAVVSAPKLFRSLTPRLPPALGRRAHRSALDPQPSD